MSTAAPGLSICLGAYFAAPPHRVEQHNAEEKRRELSRRRKKTFAVEEKKAKRKIIINKYRNSPETPHDFWNSKCWRRRRARMLIAGADKANAMKKKFSLNGSSTIPRLPLSSKWFLIFRFVRGSSANEDGNRVSHYYETPDFKDS